MDALGINIPGVVTQLVSFLVLFGVLYSLLYKPILRMLDQRSEKIRESLETAEKARQDAAQSQQDMQQQLDDARAEGQTMIAQAREVADRFREEELAKASAEISAQRSRAEAEIKRERDAAIDDLRSEFAGLAIAAAERVTQKSLDAAAHKDLINDFLEEAPSSDDNKD